MDKIQQHTFKIYGWILKQEQEISNAKNECQNSKKNLTPELKPDSSCSSIVKITVYNLQLVPITPWLKLFLHTVA